MGLLKWWTHEVIFTSLGKAYVTNLFWRVHSMVYTHTIIVEPFCFLHRFKIESVYPGTYQVTASHPVWKISQVYVVAQDNLST